MVYELGTVGMVCPFPLIEAQKKMNDLNQGDDWAAENGYPVTNYEQLDDASWTITIQNA